MSAWEGISARPKVDCGFSATSTTWRSSPLARSQECSRGAGRDWHRGGDPIREDVSQKRAAAPKIGAAAIPGLLSSGHAGTSSCARSRMFSSNCSAGTTSTGHLA
jgi:hypothetical protein